MGGSSTDIRRDTSTALIVLGSLVSAAVTVVGIVAWLLLALESALGAPWGPQLLLCGVGLPGATVGTIYALARGRGWPFPVGLAVTLIPVLLYLLLPGPPPMMAD